MKTFLLMTSFLVVSLGINSCVSRRLVFQAEAVSMTKTDAGQIKALKVEDMEIEEKWCMDDKPLIDSGDKIYGFADQVIYKAQGGGKSADYITGATIYIVGGECAVLTGKRARL